MQAFYVPILPHCIFHNRVASEILKPTEVKVMDSMLPKKLIVMSILEILKKYSDENHRLNQKKIAEILETDYNMKVDRKAIKRNLMNLIWFGYEIEYDTTTKMIKNFFSKNISISSFKSISSIFPP